MSTYQAITSSQNDKSAAIFFVFIDLFQLDNFAKFVVDVTYRF